MLDDLPTDSLVAFLPHWEMITPELVANYHARGVRVGCWTIRDEGSLATVEAAGVDFATVSDPGRFRPGSVDDDQPLAW